MVRCHVDEKKGILELGELEYHKKWYFPNYFRNSVSDPIISKISANGPFCPNKRVFWVTFLGAITNPRPKVIQAKQAHGQAITQAMIQIAGLGMPYAERPQGPR